MTTSAFAVKLVGNGGDAYAIEFADMGTLILDHIEWISSKQVKAVAFEKALEQTKIESTNDELTLERIPKDAINYPSQKRILFNRKRWSVMSNSQRAALVCHEYLGIMEIDDTGYKVSKVLLQEFGKGSFDRRLTPVEVKKLLPVYTAFVQSRAAQSLSPLDNDQIRITAAQVTNPIYNLSDPKTYKTIGETSASPDEIIRELESAVADLKSRSAKDREDEARDVLVGFNGAKDAGKISCLLGYSSEFSREATRRVVKCSDDRSRPGTKDDEGVWDVREITISIDSKTLEPVGVLKIEHGFAG